MTMVENWNRVVKPEDKVYHLGDFCFTDGGMKLAGLLNGHKRLVKGNHDLRKLKDYAQYFEDIFGARQIDGYWLTHIPMHPDGVNQPRVKANIHGHLHANLINHPKYVNVSVEQINYTPINFDEIKARYK